MTFCSMTRSARVRRASCSNAALRRLLGRRTGCAPAVLKFETGPFGKPRLQGEPRCSFSLSHSGDHALVVLADKGEIGVDLEELRPMYDMEALARQCLAERERFLFEATPLAERELALLWSWTRKEACLKALGTGLQVEPSSFDVGTDVREQRVRIDTAEGVREVVVHSLVPAPGWIAALALEEKRPKEGMSHAPSADASAAGRAFPPGWPP
jgi:4'-phosphopantetheinyl transferase